MSTTDLEITKYTKGMGFGFGGCGALPHAPAGRSSPCTPGTSCGRAQVATGKPSF